MDQTPPMPAKVMPWLFEASEDHFGGFRKSRSVSAAGNTRMLLEKLPHQIIGRDVHGGRSEHLDDGFHARPCVSATFDLNENDLAAVAASAPGLAGAFHAVGGLVGQRDDFGRCVAAVVFHPALDRVLDGAEVRHALAAAERSFAVATLKRRKGVRGAVEMHHRHGAIRVHRVDHQRAADRRDGGDAVAQLGANIMRHDATIREARGKNTTRIEIDHRGEIIEQRRREGDIVDFVLHCIAAATAAVEGEQLVLQPSGAKGIHDDETGLLRLRIQSAEPHHARWIAATAVKRDHHRRRLR